MLVWQYHVPFPREGRELLQEAWSTKGEDVWLVVLPRQLALTMHHGAGLGQGEFVLNLGAQHQSFLLGPALCSVYSTFILRWLDLVFVARTVASLSALCFGFSCPLQKSPSTLSYKPPTPLDT